MISEQTLIEEGAAELLIVMNNEALDKLLEPITWDWSSSIRARQHLVYSRHDKVKLVLPFLSGEDLERAEKWIKENKHSGLWD